MADPPESYTSDLVFQNSPLNLLAKFTAYLQARFSDDRLPWCFNQNEGDTGLFVYAEFGVPKNVTNPAPAIIVGRGTTVHNRVVVADRDQNSYTELIKGGTNSYTTAEMDVRITCLGHNYGESATLGDLCQCAVSMSRRPLTQAFTLRDISPVTLGRTVPYERDSEKWSTNVDFRVYYEQRWFVMQAAPVLQGVEMSTKLDEAGAQYVKQFTLINSSG
jgi:hypothetical protein